MVGDSTPSANATGTSGKFARPLPTLSSRNRSPLQITRNEYNTYLVTNDSNELSDVLRNAQKRERERERKGVPSVSIPRSGARRKEPARHAFDGSERHT